MKGPAKNFVVEQFVSTKEMRIYEYGDIVQQVFEVLEIPAITKTRLMERRH